MRVYIICVVISDSELRIVVEICVKCVPALAQQRYLTDPVGFVTVTENWVPASTSPDDIPGYTYLATYSSGYNRAMFYCSRINMYQ